MTIAVTSPELEAFVREQVTSGRFGSAEDVLVGALSMLRAHEQATPEEVAELRAALAGGVAEADRGETTVWDADEVAGEVERRYAAERAGG